MRWTLLLVLVFCLPLSAGDRDVLRDAVESFASEHIGARDAASRAVRRHLDRVLAPLLEAMHSKDPEVSRRARKSIASLLPDREEEEDSWPAPQVPAWGQIQVIQGAGNRIRVLMPGRNGVWVAANENDKHGKRLKAFGISSGHPATDGLLRSQLGLAAGRGFVVTDVEKGSRAARLGLRVYDIILRIGDKPVMQRNELYDAIGPEANWARLKVRVMRRGKVLELP